jgi:hypothetical protein
MLKIETLMASDSRYNKVEIKRKVGKWSSGNIKNTKSYCKFNSFAVKVELLRSPYFGWI